MKTVYFIYASIPEEVYNSRIKYLISNSHDFRWKHHKMYGLYAWTSNKKLIQEFMEIRNDTKIYDIIEKEVYENDEYNIIKEKYNELELKLKTYYFTRDKEKNKSIQIVTTKNEYDAAVSNSSENLYEFGPQIKVAIDFQIFDDELIDALDVIGYTNDYASECGDDSMRDLAGTNASYGKTICGNDMIVNGFHNEMNILLYLFHFMFYGNKRRSEVDEN